MSHRVRFCYNNFVPDATLTFSSAVTQFPGSNITNTQRSKVWKPKGNFTVTTSNQAVYINDGSDKTVNITTGDYAGPAALATQIQTDLNASSSGWTVSYDTDTGKFTLANSGSVTLRLSQSSNATWDMLGYTSTTDSTGTSFPADEQRNHTSEHVTIDLGAAYPITFLAMIGPLDEVFTLSGSATITLKANNINSFAAPALTVSLERTPGGVFKFLDAVEDTTYRYWRIEFEDRTNTVGAEGFKIGHVYLGDYTTLTNRNIANGFQKTWIDPSKGLESEGGQQYWDTRPKYLAIDNVSIEYLPAEDRLVFEQMAYDLGKSTPFYISMDPTLLVTSSLDELTRYVVFDKEPRLDHIKQGVYTLSFALRECL